MLETATAVAVVSSVAELGRSTAADAIALDVTEREAAPIRVIEAAALSDAVVDKLAVVDLSVRAVDASVEVTANVAEAGRSTADEAVVLTVIVRSAETARYRLESAVSVTVTGIAVA
jgi:hypothetical protein